MATLSDKLTTLIGLQQQEVDRMTHMATVDLPAAQTKLQQMQTALTLITVGFESNVNKLKALGVQLDA